MDTMQLIDKIDTSLAEGVDATRRAHFQIQKIMDSYREEAQLQAAKQRAAEGKDLRGPANLDGHEAEEIKQEPKTKGE